jgi:hypothetical protein
VLERLMMARPVQKDIDRRAYELWEKAGMPAGRDEEFYLQALQELQEVLDKEQSERQE